MLLVTRCPASTAPGAFAFSPDDSLITCLFSPEGSLVRQLYVYRAETGERSLLLTPPGSGALEENLSREEQLRRERQRMLTLGIKCVNRTGLGGHYHEVPSHERAAGDGTIRLERPVDLAGGCIERIQLAIHIAHVDSLLVDHWAAPSPVLGLPRS